jgi:hypothetical protein
VQLEKGSTKCSWKKVGQSVVGQRLVKVRIKFGQSLDKVRTKYGQSLDKVWTKFGQSSDNEQTKNSRLKCNRIRSCQTRCNWTVGPNFSACRTKRGGPGNSRQMTSFLRPRKEEKQVKFHSL